MIKNAIANKASALVHFMKLKVGLSGHCALFCNFVISGIFIFKE